MENYLYFATGDGADGANEIGMYPASNFYGVEPKDADKTYIWFKSPINNTETANMTIPGARLVGDGSDLSLGGGRGDIVIVTHADTHETAGSYHRCKIIAKAMAEIANASPTGELISVIDLDNNIISKGLAEVSKDANFALSFSKDT